MPLNFCRLRGAQAAERLQMKVAREGIDRDIMARQVGHAR